MKYIQYSIPLIVMLVLPWTHRLLVENIRLALPTVVTDDMTASTTVILLGLALFVVTVIWAVNSSDNDERKRRGY